MIFEMRPEVWGESGRKLGEEHSKQREQQVHKPQSGMSWEPSL